MPLIAGGFSGTLFVQARLSSWGRKKTTKSPPSSAKSRSPSSPATVATSVVPASVQESDPILTSPISPSEVHDGTEKHTIPHPILLLNLLSTITESPVIASQQADPVTQAKTDMAKDSLVQDKALDTNSPEQINDAQPPSKASGTWCSVVKGNKRELQKKGKSYILPSGESCVKIRISVIERHRAS